LSGRTAADASPAVTARSAVSPLYGPVCVSLSRLAGPSGSRCLPKVGRGDAGVERERIARTLDRDLAHLEHIAVIGQLQRCVRVLLDQQDRHPALAQRERLIS
jgi:hypothetical protein